MNLYGLFVAIAVFLLAVILIATGMVFGTEVPEAARLCASKLADNSQRLASGAEPDRVALAPHSDTHIAAEVGYAQSNLLAPLSDTTSIAERSGHAGRTQIAVPLRPRLYRLQAWKPTLVATISATTIRLGESVEVVYSTTNATACLRDWTYLAPFIGRSDGIVIPTQGRYTHTPTEVGTFVTRIMATRRAANLNHNGISEGWRRAVILEFQVQVKE